MVTTRSQTKAKRAASTAALNEQKKAKVIILNTPTYSYKEGSKNVKVYTCAADIIDAYDAYVNQQKTPLAEKQAQPKQTTAVTDYIHSPIMTRSKSKKLQEQMKVDDWKDECDNCIHNLKHAPTAKDRREFWVRTIKYLLEEQEIQNGENCLEHKTILATQIYKVLSYMFNRHFMDFTDYETFWRTTEKKTKELLFDIDEHKKKGKITDETYLLARKVLQEAQTFQIMYENLVFPK